MKANNLTKISGHPVVSIQNISYSDEIQRGEPIIISFDLINDSIYSGIIWYRIRNVLTNEIVGGTENSLVFRPGEIKHITIKIEGIEEDFYGKIEIGHYE